MAFRAPSARHRQSLSTPQPTAHVPRSTTHSPSHSLDAEEEWVVFSPSLAERTSTTASIEVGSLISNVSPAIIDLQSDHESTDTDSLQGFRDPLQEGPVMLPAHDGLGTFSSGSGLGMLSEWTGSLEESLRLVAAGSPENDRNARIHKWREEQSKAFMDEIERETRRRRLSMMSRQSSSGKGAVNVPAAQLEEYEAAVLIGDDPAATPTNRAVSIVEEEVDVDSESFWRRVTRSFIRDIMGIDDKLLEVIFGESLPDSAFDELETGSQVSRGTAETRFLKRIARELGELVGVYGTPAPEGTTTAHTTTDEEEGTRTPQPAPPASTTSSSVPVHFSPTLAHNTPNEAANWGVEEQPADILDSRAAELRKEYWEQDLSMRLVFSFLKSQLLPSRQPEPAPPIRKSFSDNHPLIHPARRPSLVSHRSSLVGSGRCGSRSEIGKYWDVASASVSSKSCVGSAVWAAI